MQGFVTALETSVTTDAMYGSLTALVPFIGGLVVFAFSYYVIRRAIRKASKGKAGI